MGEGKDSEGPSREVGGEQPPSIAKEHKLYLTGMTCAACEKLISRVAGQNGGTISSVDAKYGTATLMADERSFERIKLKLAQRGFKERREDESPDSGRGDLTRVKDYVLSLLSGEPHVEVEAKLTNYAVATAAILMGIGMLGYGPLLKGFGSSATTVTLLLLVIATSIMTIFSYHHMSCYRRSMSCMHGMMIGMTIGMMSGFMAGAITGAMNGIFIGSVVGVGIGIGFGFALGRFSGVMGAMEGIMAGLMSGTMGAMTSVMMLNDNLIAFLFLLMGICGVSMASLSYMMNREAGPAPNPEYSAGFGKFFLAAALMSVLLLAVMLYGPKGQITFIR